MPEENFKRRLCAILSADVEGYSRLMGEDEDATIRTLTTFRELMSTIIQKHRGRVVDSPGDNLLAEFGSVVDSVRCAVEIQEELRVRNAELPENRRMVFRIGINLGDVVEEGERIYGDGVNITARVEGLAEGGGICISGTVYDSIKNKLSLGYESLGEHTVKNIKGPVRVYRMRVGPDAATLGMIKEKSVVKRWQWTAMAAMVVLILGALAVWNFYFRLPPIEPASVDRMAYPLPDRPSIAVLPFDNMSEDPKQEFFSDGITEDIITALSKTPRLFVIARDSTFVYKGEPVIIQQVAEDLGVRYVLEGSVRKSENKVRVTAQLIDAVKGTHLWAEKYDRDLKDIFAIQDDITREIIVALKVKLTEGEQARIWSRGTENTKALEKAFQSLEHFRRFNPDDIILCRKKAEEALALDPNYPFASVMLAWSHLVEVWNGWSKSPGESMKKAVELGQKTIALDENSADAHALLGSIYLVQKQWDKAVEEGRRAVELLPSGSDANGLLGITLRHVGRPKEAVTITKKAMRLNPQSPNWLYHSLGAAQVLTGNYQGAITSLRRVIEKNPNHIPAKNILIAAYSLSNQDEEAKIQIKEYLKLMPTASIASWRKRAPFKNETDTDLFVNAFRRVGFPETPPLPLPDKPSIAVLPFTNMSNDPKQEYFSDGIAEDLITALSKSPKLFVIARHSSFTYKGKSVGIPNIGRELGVRYVLEGSVRKAGEKVRITAQLIDSKKNNLIWSESYDKNLKDTFDVLDEVTKSIIVALHIQLTEGEQTRLTARGTNNLQAYLKCSEATWYNLQSNKKGVFKAKKLAEEAIALDPGYAFAYTVLGASHGITIFLGISTSPSESLKRAITLSKKAVELDDSLGRAHAALGYWLAIARLYDKAFAEGRRAMSLEPYSAEVIYNYASILTFLGRLDEAIPLFKEAIRLNPLPPNSYLRHYGVALRDSGQYDKAIVQAKKAIEQESNDLIALVILASSLSMAGRDAEARTATKEILRINPKFSVTRWEKNSPHKDRSTAKRYCDGLRKVGLPD